MLFVCDGDDDVNGARRTMLRGHAMPGRREHSVAKWDEEETEAKKRRTGTLIGIYIYRTNMPRPEICDGAHLHLLHGQKWDGMWATRLHSISINWTFLMWRRCVYCFLHLLLDIYRYIVCMLRLQPDMEAFPCNTCVWFLCVRWQLAEQYSMQHP